MIRAIFFDFNGVIVDDEPLHFQLFQKVLGEEGVPLSKEDYYAKYLGMDDHDCFQSAMRDLKKTLSEKKIKEMIRRKASYYQQQIKTQTPYVPGVLKLIQNLAETHYLAVVSGALREEIVSLLSYGKIREVINVIVAAQDVKHGKPNPEGFDKAMQILNRDFVASSEMLLPHECLVIEDSIWGIEAAGAADMPCIAMTTSYSESELPGAAFYLKDFDGIDFEKILKTF